MNTRLAFALAGIFVIASCSAETISDSHIRQLFEHWRWKQYWAGRTEFGQLYRPGRQFQALLFWPIDDSRPSVGFCSAELGVCQYYPRGAADVFGFVMPVLSGEDSQAAFRRILADSFGQALPVARLPLVIGQPPVFEPAPIPVPADYRTETVSITLPVLDPPRAIRERTPRPHPEIDALVSDLSCLADQPGCRFHLMVPFYSPSDPYVPVFRQCFACPYPKSMIIFMTLVEGHWWHGATDFSDRPEVVDRMRKQIEKALMFEVEK